MNERNNTYEHVETKTCINIQSNTQNMIVNLAENLNMK